MVVVGLLVRMTRLPEGNFFPPSFFEVKAAAWSLNKRGVDKSLIDSSLIKGFLNCVLLADEDLL